MTKYWEKAYALARQAALGSPGTGRSNNYRVGACVFGDGNFVFRGNSYKTHPFALRNSKYPFLHAETHCIVSLGLDNCRNKSIIVTRVLRDNKTFTMAKPCPECQRALKFAGVKDIFFTDWNGEIKCL